MKGRGIDAPGLEEARDDEVRGLWGSVFRS